MTSIEIQKFIKHLTTIREQDIMAKLIIYAMKNTLTGAKRTSM